MKRKTKLVILILLVGIILYYFLKIDFLGCELLRGGEWISGPDAGYCKLPPTIDEGEACQSNAECEVDCLLVSERDKRNRLQPKVDSEGYFVGECGRASIFQDCRKVIPLKTKNENTLTGGSCI